MAVLTFKDADISELPEIISLITRSKSHFHPNKERYVTNFVQAWGPNTYYIEDNILLIAKHQNTSIGIIGMRAPSSKRHFAELDLLFIDNLFIGQGYGKQLWNKAKEIAKKEDWESFQFISDNTPEVVGFYEKMGAASIENLTLATGCFPIMEYILPNN
ncbi:GNAT family N-acetyltransferase [Legionella gresilensis]|uniref:GNAT family N-acetyltransferase n=1 Tax=Legionella gresilensis TaxID=91823 RepID=UPI00104199E3|nr:GNAT family N-acetyltransferase [Legionella gresilensis]